MACAAKDPLLWPRACSLRRCVTSVHAAFDAGTAHAAGPASTSTRCHQTAAWGRSGPSALNSFSVTPGRRRRRSGAAVTRTVSLVRKRHVSGPSQHRVGAVSTEDPDDACDSYCRKAGPP